MNCMRRKKERERERRQRREKQEIAERTDRSSTSVETSLASLSSRLVSSRPSRRFHVVSLERRAVSKGSLPGRIGFCSANAPRRNVSHTSTAGDR